MAETLTTATGEQTANPGEQAEKVTDFITTKNGDNYVVDGPLSRAYSEALNELYKKEIDPTSGIALETQAIDALHSQMDYVEKKAAKIFLDNKAANLGLIYGVELGSTTPEDLIEITDSLSVMTPEQKNKSGVIIDAAIQNESTGEVPEIKTDYINPVEVALEQLCAKHGVHVYKSLASFVKLNS